MPKSYIEIIKTNKTKSAVEDYITLGKWDKEPMSSKDREAWQELWLWFCATDNKATLAFSVITKVSK